MKKIAIIRPDENPLSTGFYNSQEIGLAKALVKYNCDVDIFMSTLDKQIKTEVISEFGIGTITIYKMPFVLIPEISHALYPGLIKILKKKDYDLIQVNEENELTCFWVARYAYKAKIPCVVYQGMYQPLSGRIRAVFQKTYDIFLLPYFRKYISHAFTKTSRAKLHLENKGFNNISVIPVGLDTSVFNNSKKRDLKTEFSIPENVKILLYVGVFEKRRNIDFLLDVVKNLPSEEYHLLLIGDGPIYHDINKRISDETINNITLAGKIPQNEIKNAYEIGDFFLLASNYEIYGMVILESLYFGCPVISTKTAGSEDLITNGNNGYIIDNLNVEDWSECIKNNVESINGDLLTEYVEKNYTWGVIAQKYLDNAFDKYE